MSRSRRGWVRSSLVPACLVVLASAAATCGNASWSAPPRFDGAGYAVLARALLAGQGYRAIDHPDRPRHAHFPPGYPLLLAATWRLTGESAAAAHAVSALCTVGACLAAWLWFRRLMPGPASTLLGLALAVNWLWSRTGGAIQSEPLYLLLGQLTILRVAAGGRRTAMPFRDAIVTGTLLAACLLTRHAAIGLAVAVLLELCLRRRWRDALAVAMVAGLLVAPWLIWMATAGPEGRTQAGLLVRGDGAWFSRIFDQLVFYVRRIPDQITGPFVEVGTVFRRSAVVSVVANFWAVAATAVVVVGWIRHPAPAASTPGRDDRPQHDAGVAGLAVHGGRTLLDPDDPVHPDRCGRGVGGRPGPACLVTVASGGRRVAGGGWRVAGGGWEKRSG